MNGETEDGNTPVRRSGRARRPNSRFAEDELDGSIKKIVIGSTTPESPASSSTTGGTPVRQKKGGKKRESDSEEVYNSPPGPKDATIAIAVSTVVPQSPAKNNDIVNGLVNESDTVTASMGRTKSSGGKPQERRTRSNVKKKNPVESPPTEERKRVGRKGTKGKPKGSEEGHDIAHSESEVEKVDCQKESSIDTEKINPQVNPTNISKSVDADQPLGEIRKDDVHVQVSDVQTPIKDLVSKGKKNVKKQELDTDSEKVTKVLDPVISHFEGAVSKGKKKDGSQESHTAGEDVTKLHDLPLIPSKGVSKGKKNQDSHIGTSEKLPKVNEKDSISSREEIKDYEKLVNIGMKDSQAVKTPDEAQMIEKLKMDKDLNLQVASPKIKFSINSAGRQSPSSFVPQLKEFEMGQDSDTKERTKLGIKSSSKPSPSKLRSKGKGSVRTLNTSVQGEQSSIPVDSRNKNVTNDQGIGGSLTYTAKSAAESGKSTTEQAECAKDVHLGTTEHQLGLSKQSSDISLDHLSQGKKIIDFSEAETSTPARPGTQLGICKESADLPMQDKGHVISEAKIGISAEGSEHIGSTDVNVGILSQPEDHTVNLEGKPPVKRKGRNSSHLVKGVLKDQVKKKALPVKDQEKRKGSDVDIVMKNLGVKRLTQGQSSEPNVSEEDHTSTSSEKVSNKEFTYIPQNTEIPADANDERPRESDHGDALSEAKKYKSEELMREPDDANINVKRNVTRKGKRSRFDQPSTDSKSMEGVVPTTEHERQEEMAQSVTEEQKSPEQKKRRVSEAGCLETAESDQKRKWHGDPEDEDVKRKRKKDDSLIPITTKPLLQGEGTPMIEDLCNLQEAKKILASIFKSDNESNNNKQSSADKQKESTSSALPEEIPGKLSAVNEGKQNIPSLLKEKKGKKHNEKKESKVVNDIEDKRQSSVGNILSFLKRPSVDKIEDDSDGKGKKDCDSPEVKQMDDNKWGVDASKSERTKKDKKWRTTARDEFPEKRKHEEKEDFLGESPVRYPTEDRSRVSASNYERPLQNFQGGDFAWDSMKDVTSPTPSSFEGKRKKPIKKAVEPEKELKGKESDLNVRESVEGNDVEEKRTSSIGNILSFLKRGNQSGGQPNQEDSQISSEENSVPSFNQEALFNLVENTRKSIYKRDESYTSYGKPENDSHQKSKSKPRERRQSRWGDRDETPKQWENVQTYEQKNEASPLNREDKRSQWPERKFDGPSFSKWEDTSSDYQAQYSSNKERERPSSKTKSGATGSYDNWNDHNSRWKSWDDQPCQGAFAPQDNVYSAETIDKKITHLSTENQMKENLSEDNLDFGNREGMSEFIESREGMSEFIESYADELDQSTEVISSTSSQQNLYPDPIVEPSMSHVSGWHSKNVVSLSANREIYPEDRDKEMYSVSRDKERFSAAREKEIYPEAGEKELSSPPRERVWSPRSNEIVLSPKSRELMSSLRNMEVKLTPQMEELISSQKKLDSILTPELHNFSMKQEDNDSDSSSYKRRKDGANTYDGAGISLSGNSGLPVKKEARNIGSFGKPEFLSASHEKAHQMITDVIRGASTQEVGRSSQESNWRSHSDKYDRPRASRFDEVKTEHVRDVEHEKENHWDEPLKSRSNVVKEEIHDDKENLEPKLKEKDFSEAERLEHQGKARDERNRAVVEQRMRSFVHLKENLYLGDRKKSKKSKEVRRMVCDCSLTKEESAHGEVGCGEDCLNRLLMIECGSRCPLKDRCTNKHFQTYDYADVEVFNAEEKGCGIRAKKVIPAGTFLMEYVGEVFDSKEFKRRRKEYSKNHNAHFYFMALKGDLFIDATRKGNISRFINHSCDPNAQTQKWTVNGELRIGFFAQKTIEVDEEINFDYRLERYGREPQRCFCGTANCRGWLGESPDEKTKEEKEEEKKQERDRRKHEEKQHSVEDSDVEDEIDKLNAIKIRTRQDILNLCRLMVRADTSESRVILLRLVQTSTSACKRLFMDYHGLSLLWSWMADLGYAYQHASIKIEILKTLECLPVTNKTQLTDSRVLGIVERWSTQSVEIPISGSPPPPPPPRPRHLGLGNADSYAGKKSSDTSEDSDVDMDTKPVSTTVDSSSVDDASMDSVDVEQDALKSKPNLEGCLAEDDSSDSNQSEEKKSAVEPGEGDAAATASHDNEASTQELYLVHKSMVELANKLLEQWKDLKEYFRIPKRERIELMKEHEREVEEEIRGLDKDRKEKDKYRRDFDRRRRSPDREKERERHTRRGSRSDRDPREDRSLDSPKMSKEQRRQLFEIQVQQEEKEAKQRKMQEEMWAMHVERCRILSQDPYLTPIFDPTCQYYWDPLTGSWQAYSGVDPNVPLPVPAAYGYRPSENGDGSPMIVGMPPGHPIAAHPLAGHLASDGEAATPNLDDPLIDLATIPLPGEIRQTSPTQPVPGQAVPVEGTPPQGASVLPFSLAAEPGVPPAAAVATAATGPINLGTVPVVVPFRSSEEQPVPPSGPITIQLPPRWKMARDSQGHVYFYHVKSRTSQWEPPTLEQHRQLEAGMGGSDSDSDSSSSDSDSTSTTDSEDFSSDEEEEEEEEQVTTVERGELCDEKMIRRHRGKKSRPEALVQERVISPVLEMDKEAARRERREAKERAQKEARQERQDDRSHDVTLELSEPRDDSDSMGEKLQRMDKTEITVERDRYDYRDRENKSKQRDKVKSKERLANAIADNSDIARRCKENFRAKMATYIVSVLNPYRRDDCKIGRITCNEDFKYLARKLTHFVMIKELKQLHSVEDLECNDSVKYKTKDFVRKYMSKYGREFKRDPTDTKEY